MVRRIVDHRHQHRVTVADVARLIRLHRQEHRGQRIVAVARRCWIFDRAIENVISVSLPDEVFRSLDLNW